ncbi:MAG: hypothetical protein HC837_19455 [Chloroflexaceae bacterium]|nr:hypothetical protein [Chloroflexaceae bacterium]
MHTFNDIGIRTKILSVVVISLILNSIVAVVVYWGILASLEREDEVTFTHEIITLTDDLLLQW